MSLLSFLGFRSRKRAAICASAAVCVSLAAAAPALMAQPFTTNVTFSPAAPNSMQQISSRIDFEFLGCGFSPSTAVTGTTIRTTVQATGCVLGPPGLAPAQVVTEFGPLAPGTYDYEVYFRYENSSPELDHRRTLVVVAAPAGIPTVGTFALVILTAALCLVGLVLVRQS